MRIFIGRSASGKTTEILKEIAEKCEKMQGKQILLVPELHSHLMERRLAACTKNHGARTAEVLTFSRLADRVFAECGGLAEEMLSAAGQLLMLQRAAKNVQTGLSVWNDIASKTELLKKASRLIEECKAATVSSEMLFKAAEQSEDNILTQKLTDLAQLQTAYERLCEQTIADPRDRLTHLADLIVQSEIFANAELYIDGFSGFTKQEYHVLFEIMKKKTNITFALTADEDDDEVFSGANKTQKTLMKMAEKCGEPTEIIDFGASKAQKTQDLIRLEKDALHCVRQSGTATGDSVRIYAGASPFNECEHAAAYILQKVREEGCHFSDFIVTARDITTYSAPLEMAMARYEVPAFFAGKEDLLFKPPIALVLGALQAVIGNFQYEDMFACFKTNLTMLSFEEVDKLENYVLTWDIKGGAWCREWDEHPDGYGMEQTEKSKQQLQGLNELRQKAIAPFVNLREQISGKNKAKDSVSALYEFLCALDVPLQIEERANMHENANRIQLADEYRQLWDILVSAMEQFAWLCSETEFTAEQFVQMFALILGEYEVSSIPVSLDRVTCGSMERVCSEQAKHVILLGVNDGIVPNVSGEKSLFSDADREKLDGLGIELGIYGMERIFKEQEILYRALACPTDSLLLSYHTSDNRGSETRPSYFIGIIQGLLDGLPFESYQTAGQHDYLQADKPALELACSYVAGARNPAARAAFAHYQTDERIIKAEKQRSARGSIQDTDIMHALYGKSLNLTASRVDAFYSCRFAFFMQYGLKAKPRKKAKFDAMQTGTFIHYVLENALILLQKKENGIAQATEKEIQKVCRKVTDNYITEELGGLAKKTARFRYLFQRLCVSVEKILQNVIEEMKVSDFAPIDYELDFSRNGDLPPVTCENDEVSVSLSGKVDRVDGYIKDGKLYLRIMDYKSGKKAFSLSDIWHGLNMQLIIYLYALQEKGLERYKKRVGEQLNEVVPAGVLYVPAREDLPEADRETDEEELRMLRDKALRRSGILSDDMELVQAMEQGLSGKGRFIPVTIKIPKGEDEPVIDAKSAVTTLERFGKLAKYTHKKLLEMGEELNKGSVLANPCKKDKNSVFCDFCEFRSACQFDEQMGDKARLLKHYSDAEFWDLLGGEAYAAVDKTAKASN